MRILALLLLLPALAFGQALNPKVTQANIGSTICVPGWTKTIRPPVSYTNRIKRRLMDKRGLDWSLAHEFELDHIEPLALGGHPTDPRNLQLQPWEGKSGAHAKDVIEVRMKRLVCRGKISLHAARECMAHNWRACP